MIRGFAVLTATVQELSYKNLDTVQDGGGAQQAYLRAIGLAGVDNGIADIELIRKQLLAFCELGNLCKTQPTAES